jgi:hypothetical protein
MLVRRKAAAHKRLMILATLAITGPAINRWPFPPAVRLPGTLVIFLILPLFVVAYDLWSTRRVARVTAIATALIYFQALTLIPLANLPIWQPVINEILK